MNLSLAIMLPTRLKSVSLAAGSIVIVTACLTIYGWLFGLELLTRIRPAWPPMFPNTALVFLLAGSALLFGLREGSTTQQRIAQACAWGVVLLALITLGEYMFGWTPGIDHLLLPLSARGQTLAGRISPNATLSFLLIGSALLMQGKILPSGQRPADYLALSSGVIALITLLGYLYGATSLNNVAGHPGMALHAALLFLLLAVGLLCLHPERGLVAVVISRSAGGAMARRLLLAALLVPAVLSWVNLAGERLGRYEASFGTALLIATNMVVLLIIVWRNAESLHRVYLKRQEAEASLHQHNLDLVEEVHQRTGELEQVNLQLRAESTAREQTLGLLDQSREQLADLFENAPIGIHLVGPDGIIQSANRAELEMLGYQPEEYIGHHVGDFHADPATIGEILARLLGGEIIDNQEARLRAKDGTIRHVLISSNVRWHDQKFVHTRCFTRDITERKEIETERHQLFQREQQARQRAEESTRSKDEFLAIVSHELRTPLNAILGWTQLLRNTSPEPATMAKALETVERNARAQDRIIADLLALTDTLTGKSRLNLTAVDPLRLLEEALESVRPAAEARKITLQPLSEAQVGPISGDGDRLRQVFWNLLTNALKFTPAGGQIQVHLAQVGSFIEITVSDTGQGIAPEFLPFVFERFSQADSSSTRLQGGLGLGLAIAREVVAMHGGTIQADSGGVGQGATFTVRLPLRAERNGTQGALPPMARSAESKWPECPPQLAGLKIIVVDDDADSRELVSALLTRCGAEVRMAASAATAVQLYQEWPPDLLIADIEMPDRNGYELLGQLRKLEAGQARRPLAIALTAHARAEDRLRALTAGFQMHVAKPVEVEELLAIVASLSGRMNFQKTEA